MSKEEWNEFVRLSKKQLESMEAPMYTQSEVDRLIREARIEEASLIPDTPTSKPAEDKSEWWTGFGEGEARVFRLWRYKRRRLEELSEQEVNKDTQKSG